MIQVDLFSQCGITEVKKSSIDEMLESIASMDIESKIQSAIESIVNVVIGYTVGVVSQMLIFPMFGIVASLSDNMAMALWFTAVSLVRSYVIRRMFNRSSA